VLVAGVAMSGPARHGEAALVFRFRTPIEVRFRDLDALGHVNNAVYLTYFEIARSAYFAALRGRPLGVEDIGVVVAEASCRYRSPAFYGERLIAEVATVALRSRSFELRYRITVEEGGRLVAEGHTVQVAYDQRAKRTVVLSAAFRQAVESFEGRALDGRRE
jgi:acyl-CoA thioester hydrolase